MIIARVFSALVMVSILACASAPETEQTRVAPQPARPSVLDGMMRELAPRSGTPRFLGVSPRMHNRDDEEDRAILHVAEQASRYIRMAARYQLVTQREGRSIGFLENIDAAWDEQLADQLVESVTVLRTHRDDQGTFVLASVSGLPTVPVLVPDAGRTTGEPEWISRPPEIPGFLVTVGVSRRSHRLRDSLDTADQEALKEILLEARSTVRLMEERVDVDRVGTLQTIRAAQNAEALLRQFLVLSRYASSDGRYYYSLVIAREE